MIESLNYQPLKIPRGGRTTIRNQLSDWGDSSFRTTWELAMREGKIKMEERKQ
jgi:hypothetical protein